MITVGTKGLTRCIAHLELPNGDDGLTGGGRRPEGWGSVRLDDIGRLLVEVEV
jgi:hypothetical protein